jgi:hypothetical protein
MAALVLRYPPFGRQRAAMLAEREAVCARLLRSLGSSRLMRVP